MRKNILILVLLFCGGFSLTAQAHTGVSIYVPLVNGIGSKPGDNSLLYNQLVSEVKDLGFNAERVQSKADYSLIGTLAPYSDDGHFSFHLELLDNKTGETTVEGELVYETVDDINSLFPDLVSTLVYTIPEDDGKPEVTGKPKDTGTNDDFLNRWLYIGASAFWTPSLYTGDSKDNIASFGAGFSAELHVLNFLSLEAGLELVEESVANTKYHLLEIPLLLKFVVKPNATRFMIEPYAGLQLNIIPYTSTIKPSWGTFLAGLQYGIKTGPGLFFVDARLGIDLEKSEVKDPNPLSFQRTTFHLGFGYKFGIFQKE